MQLVINTFGFYLRKKMLAWVIYDSVENKPWNQIAGVCKQYGPSSLFC